MDKVISTTEELSLGLPIEYKAITIGILLVVLAMTFLLKKKFANKRIHNHLVKRKAFLQLTPKQSFQVISYNNREYILLVSQDNSTVVNQLKEEEVKKSYLEVVESL